MFGSVGINEIMLILVLALLIFGPKRLPQIGRTVGKALGEFRRASTELKRTVEVEMREIDDVMEAEPAPTTSLNPSVRSVERGAVSEPASIEPTATEPVESEPVESESVESEPDPTESS